MIAKLSIVLMVAIVIQAREQNIPVTVAGKQAFIEPDQLLEAALTKVLVPSYNVSRVGVDDERTEATFEAKIYSYQDLGADFITKLQNIVRSNLTFADASVRPRSEWFSSTFHIGETKTEFTIILNPQTYRKTMERIAKDYVNATNVSLKDSEWD